MTDPAHRPCCACLLVKYFPVEIDGLMRERWCCVDCGTHFKRAYKASRTQPNVSPAILAKVAEDTFEAGIMTATKAFVSDGEAEVFFSSVWAKVAQAVVDAASVSGSWFRIDCASRTACVGARSYTEKAGGTRNAVSKRGVAVTNPARAQIWIVCPAGDFDYEAVLCEGRTAEDAAKNYLKHFGRSDVVDVYRCDLALHGYQVEGA